jgi:hypothetical protein
VTWFLQGNLLHSTGLVKFSRPSDTPIMVPSLRPRLLTINIGKTLQAQTPLFMDSLHYSGSVLQFS